MYEVDSNWPQVKEKLRRAVGSIEQMAVGPDSDLSAIMRRGIQSHFNRLSLGGGSDPSALGPGDGATSPVRWIIGSRHPFTVLSHRVRGVSPNQLLIHTGKMRDDFTVSAVITGHRAPHGSDVVLSGATQESIDKARRNLQGGTVTTDFPVIAKSNVVVRLPSRQFVYWDTVMRYDVEQAAMKKAEREWSR